MIPIKPKGDKGHAYACPHRGTLESGKVLLQIDAPWLDDFRSEVLAFPKGKHDDQVDALSQLMTWAGIGGFEMQRPAFGVGDK